MITKFRVEHWDQHSNFEVYRPREDVSRRTDIIAQQSKIPGNLPSFELVSAPPPPMATSIKEMILSTPPIDF